MGNENPQELGQPDDSPSMDPAELAQVATAIAALTTALNAFVTTAHTLYPNLASDLKLRRALRMWRGETSYGHVGQSPTDIRGDSPTDNPPAD